MAEDNSKMHYLNVGLTGLNGRHHPALGGIISTQEVKKCRIHLKMLAGDYFTYEVKANQSGGSPHCRCCPYPSPAENLEHILTSCVMYSDIRIRIKSEYEEACTLAKSDICFKQICGQNSSFCQFILDPASFNLKTRVHMNDPILGTLFKITRDFCYAVNSKRMKTLSEKS